MPVATVGTTAGVAAGIVAYFVVGPIAQGAILLLLALGASAVLVGGARRSPADRRAWYLLAAGVGAMGLGDLAYGSIETGSTPVAVPAVPDVLYLAGYVGLGAGLYRLARRGGLSASSLLDTLAITVVAGFIARAVLMGRSPDGEAVSTVTGLLATAYPLLDVAFLVVAVQLLLTDRGGRRAYRMLAAGMASLLVADVAYGIGTIELTYTSGASVLDGGYLLAYIFWGWAGIHAPQAGRAPREAVEAGRGLGLRLGLLAACAVTLPVLALTHHIIGRDPHLVAASFGTSSAAVLIVLRLRALVLALRASQAGLHARLVGSRRLAAAGTDLLSAKTLGDVRELAATAALRLIADPPHSALVARERSDGAGVTILAAAGDAGTGLTGRHVERDVLPGGAVVLRRGDEHVPGTWSSVPIPSAASAGMHLLVSPAVSDEVGFETLRIWCSQVGLALDRTEAAARAAVRHEQRLFGALVHRSADLIATLDTDLGVTYQSPSVRRVLGRDPDDILGRHLPDMLHPDDAAGAGQVIASLAEEPSGTVRRLTARMAHGSGGWRTVEMDVTNLLDDPDVAAIVVNGRDVTEQKELEAELTRRAFHDDLTGLPNRALFLDRLRRSLLRTVRSGSPVAVLFVDVDHFKVVNDSLGHAVGDRLLLVVGERLRAITRAQDTVARLGGDEFAVLLEEGDVRTDAPAVAGRIVTRLAQPVELAGDQLPVGVSVGVAFAEGGATPDEVLRNADLALYTAKNAGRGRYEFFSPRLLEDARRHLDLSSDLRQAAAAGQLELFYQPIVSIASGAVEGWEALLRWRHPRYGMLLPAEFVRMAEDDGLIPELGRWVVRRACQDAAAWEPDLGDHPYVSVNLSARQLADPDLARDVREALSITGLPPDRLVLELTETVLIRHLDAGVVHLRELRAEGVRVAVDDFGTGYSSLSYLLRLPIDVLKIDKSFIDTVATEAAVEAMVRAVIDLATTLGLDTVAEGVETAEQLAAVARLGCRYAQGFVFSRPAGPASWLERDPLDGVGSLGGRLPAEGGAGSRLALSVMPRPTPPPPTGSSGTSS